MQEIFKKLNPQIQTENEKTEIEFETDLQNIIGASIAKDHRLIYFETEQTEPFYIDFVPHFGATNTIYLIPSGHLLYLPYSTIYFHCINIPHSCINDIEKCWIYSLKYKNNKSIHVENLKTSHLQNLQKKNIIPQAFYKQITPHTSIFQYLQQAEELMLCLANFNCSHQLSLKELKETLNITEKTLQRVCSTVFEFSPMAILRYHLILKIIFEIIYDKQKSLSVIANELHFRDVSTFSRYVRQLTRLTPKEIREAHYHIIL